jgi:energy-converting hydrogenase Eha subunit G
VTDSTLAVVRLELRTPHATCNFEHYKLLSALRLLEVTTLGITYGVGAESIISSSDGITNVGISGISGITYTLYIPIYFGFIKYFLLIGLHYKLS